MANTETKVEDGIKWYRCCSCNSKLLFTLDNVGALSDDGCYCPTCTKKHINIELEVWYNHMTSCRALMHEKQINLIRSIVWLPQNKSIT